jgi:PEP-CTERM motif
LGPGPAAFDNEKLFDEDAFGLLRVDFASLVNFVSIDLLFDDDDIGLLKAFDSSDNVLETVTGLGDGRGSSSGFCPPFCLPSVTVSISRPSNDIAYILAGGQHGEGLFLDTLQFSRAETIPEPTTLALITLGLACVGCSNRRKHKTAQDRAVMSQISAPGLRTHDHIERDLPPV